MFNGLKIKKIIEDKGIIFSDVFEAIGMSGTTFYKITSEEGNPKADNLEKLADYLHCSIDDFFDRDIEIAPKIAVSGNGNKVQHGDGNVMSENQAREIEHLHQLLAAKDEIIETQRELIKSLKK